MKCADCDFRKENDAVAEMEEGVSWYCTKKHSECEDLACLMRMLLWEVGNLIEALEE